MEQQLKLIGIFYTGPALGQVDLARALEEYPADRYALGADESDAAISLGMLGGPDGSPTLAALTIPKGTIQTFCPIPLDEPDLDPATFRAPNGPHLLRYRASPVAAAGELRLYRVENL